MSDKCPFCGEDTQTSRDANWAREVERQKARSERAEDRARSLEVEAECALEDIAEMGGVPCVKCGRYNLPGYECHACGCPAGQAG